MKFNLTTRIIAPYLFLGVVVVLVFFALMAIEARMAKAERWRVTLTEIQSGVHEITSRVQSGILTLQNEHNIAAAQLANEIHKKLVAPDAIQPQAAELLEQFQDFYAGVVSINSLYLEKRPTEGEKRLNQVRELQKAIGAAVADHRAQSVQTLEQLLAFSRGFMAVMVVVFLLFSMSIVLFVRQKIVTPINEVAHALEEMAKGQSDMTAQLPVSAIAEIGGIARSFNQLMGSLRHQFLEVRTSAESIQTASVEIASGNLDLSHRTEQTATSLQETTQALEIMFAHIRSSAEQARKADQLASSAAEVAQRGGAVVAQVVSTMDEINTSSRKIADIVGVIDSIAFQTNILALNAAVEAARAGEQGRGFAVVASEVRALAGRSAVASQEIRHLIEASVARVATGSVLVAQAGATMDEVVTAVQSVSGTIAQVSTTAATENKEVLQLTTSIKTVDDMTQQNAALVEQSSAAAQSLSHQAQKLSDIVASFKLD
jgi:methyl-accepting chemotaxis protein